MTKSLTERKTKPGSLEGSKEIREESGSVKKTRGKEVGISCVMNPFGLIYYKISYPEPLYKYVTVSTQR